MQTPVAGSGPDTVAPVGADSWLNPEYLQTFAPATCRQVVLPAATPTLLLGMNPQRVGFTLFKSAGMTALPRLAPVPDVVTFGLREDSNNDVITVSLSQWLSFTMGEWYAYSTNGGTVLVCEFQPSF